MLIRLLIKSALAEHITRLMIDRTEQMHRSLKGSEGRASGLAIQAHSGQLDITHREFSLARDPGSQPLLEGL